MWEAGDLIIVRTRGVFGCSASFTQSRAYFSKSFAASNDMAQAPAWVIGHRSLSYITEVPVSSSVLVENGSWPTIGAIMRAGGGLRQGPNPTSERKDSLRRYVSFRRAPGCSYGPQTWHTRDPAISAQAPDHQRNPIGCRRRTGRTIRGSQNSASADRRLAARAA